VDASDSPHISYFNFTSKDLQYAKWTGSAWSIEVVESGGANTEYGEYSSLTLNASGYPHIGYSYRFTMAPVSGNLKYAKWTGSTWSTEDVDAGGIDEILGLYASIELGPGDQPHISYYNMTGGDLKYASIPEFEGLVPPLMGTCTLLLLIRRRRHSPCNRVKKGRERRSMEHCR
jgi:hypothetical protein